MTGRQHQEVAVVTICVLASAAAVAWLYLLACHGGYWRTGQRLPRVTSAPVTSVPGPLPAITAVIPARNEAEMLPACLPSLLGQGYAGQLSVIVVDDDSSDSTAKTAARLGEAAGSHELAVVSARPTPEGWAGKVWAMSEGVRAAASETRAESGRPDSEYFLFTDADIAYAPGTVERLARSAAAGQFALVSQMALLRTDNRAERLLIPAFVYFFAQLYPFRRVSRGARTAAAAGGCMLVRADMLAAAGGLGQISAARIDDVALARLLKQSGGRIWLGLTTDVVSRRPYRRLADIWDMVARSAYTQLRYSLAMTVGTIIGIAWLYVLPPVAAVAGLAALAAGGAGTTGIWLAASGLAGWLIMSVTYLPMLRLYGLSPLRAPSLPLIAAMYAAMTADSARRHLLGRGGEWKGRVTGSHHGRRPDATIDSDR
jgi:hopene-associated glycosyltransferase HpnB